MRPTVIELAVLMVGMCTVVNVAQTLKPRPPGGTQQNADLPVGQVDRKSVDDLPIVMPMTVEAGTPIKVAIESEVRIRTVGQTIRGKTTEPVYAFDKLLVPVGTGGEWQSVSNRSRTKDDPNDAGGEWKFFTSAQSACAV
jgi:hypothetical protein